MGKNRIAIVDQEKCKPTKCKRECISFCPPQSNGREVIKIVDIEEIGKLQTKPTDKKTIAQIVESTCVGCNICVKKCPFGAISIINLPYENKADIIHRYGPNGFRLYKLPVLKKNCVMGFIGPNGVGKTTLVNILSGNLIPNFESDIKSEKAKIPSKFRGTVLYDYLRDLYGNKLKISIKPQKVKSLSGNLTVKNFLGEKTSENVISQLELAQLFDKQLNVLSGGELQRVLCAQVILSLIHI
jgi:ATP-binding cassette subfamily E protein 1